MISGPSRAYRLAVAEGARHHAQSKTYSGSLLRPHKPFLSDMIARLGIGSALDYGCGKGLQYQWRDPADGKTLEEAWGFEVAKYDPCWPPFAAEPQGRFDLVICTHTLSLIPVADLRFVMERIVGLARKGVFVAEKIGQRKKAEVADPGARAINWGADAWIEFINGIARLTDMEIVLSLRTMEARGKITRRHIWRAARFVEMIEAQGRD